MEQEKLWTLEEVIENTRKGIIEMHINDTNFNKNKIDLSYITQELIDDYRQNAKDKNPEKLKRDNDTIETDENTGQNVACYWGNNWVHISKKKWSYQNNHSGDGCDPVTTSCLCGSGHKWRCEVSQLQGRYCANGVKKPMMAWR